MAGGSVTAPIFDGKTAEKIVAEAEELASGDGGADADEDDVQSEDVRGGAGVQSNPRKTFYTVAKVVGAVAAGDSSKFCGSSPNIAARKAARRIWNRSGKRKFDLIMRKVCREKKGRTLHKYHARVTRRADPIAFFAAKASSFANVDGSTAKNVFKRIHIVKLPASPYYGYIDSDGDVVACAKSKDKKGEGSLFRVKGTNTLVMGLAENERIPRSVGPHKVVRDDHVVEVRKVAMNVDDEASADEET